MMLYPAMNKLTANVPNRYLLVNVVARRARQIAQEAEDMGEKMDVKPVTLAIHEVADGKRSAAASDIDIKDVEYPHKRAARPLFVCRKDRGESPWSWPA